jgi:Zn-dependent protease with chaperone function
MPLLRRWSSLRALIFLLSAVCLLLALLCGPAHSQNVPDRPLLLAGPSGPVHLSVSARAISYQRKQYTLAFFSIAWHALGLWLLLASRASSAIRTAVYRVLHRAQPPPGKAPPFLATLFYFAFYTLALAIWSLPISLISLLLERAYGFSNETWPTFCRDLITAWLTGLIMAPVIWLAYRLYGKSPARWWLWLWAALMPLLFVQFVLQPVLIAPLYNRFTPLPDGKLRQDILALAGRAGVTGARVFVSDTSVRTRHVNAYVAGLGPTTRIVINDTALHTLPEDELLAMLGHELGHYVEGHVWVLLASSTAGAGLFLFAAARLLPYLHRKYGPRWELAGLTDLAALPLVMLVLYLFLMAQEPLANAISRILEHRADAYGLRLTGLNDANARLFASFAERDYSDPDPPWLIQFWFGTHPTLVDRIAFARSFRSR